MTRSFMLIAFSAMIQTCDTRSESGSIHTDDTEAGTPTVEHEVTRPCDVCAVDAELDFHVWGEGLSRWEGRRVMATAVEDGYRRRVLLDGEIRNGAFSLFCPRSLEENCHYPSWAVFIDVDGDQRCSDGDVGYQQVFYCWPFENSNVGEALPAAGWRAISEVGPFALRAPLGSDAADFCEGYFEF